MSNPRNYSGFTVFLLFFGAATIDAIVARSWLHAVAWLAFGALFLLADKYSFRKKE